MAIKEYNRVLGLDLSLTGTGWCANSRLATKTGVIDTSKLDGIPRMDKILYEVRRLLNDTPEEDNGENLSQFKMDHWSMSDNLVVMEDFSFASKGAALFQIAGLGYLVRHLLWKNSIHYVLVPPTMVKKFATGTGTAIKSLMLKEVYKRWGADLSDDNEADAYTLAKIGRAILGWDTELTGFQGEVIKKLEI